MKNSNYRKLIYILFFVLFSCAFGPYFLHNKQEKPTVYVESQIKKTNLFTICVNNFRYYAVIKIDRGLFIFPKNSENSNFLEQEKCHE